jgi:hypothetical protein
MHQLWSGNRNRLRLGVPVIKVEDVEDDIVGPGIFGRGIHAEGWRHYCHPLAPLAYTLLYPPFSRPHEMWQVFIILNLNAIVI